MGVRLLTDSHADGVTLTATSEAISVDNLTDTDVQNVWRSTSIADQTITIPFGSSKDVNVVVLENVNTVVDEASFTLQLSDDGFSTVKYAEQFSTLKAIAHKAAVLYPSGAVDENRVVDGNGDAPLDTNGDATLCDTYSVSLPISATHARIVVADPSVSDSFYEIGRIKIGEYFSAPNSHNIAENIQYSHPERGQLIRTRSGGFRAEQKTAPRQLTVNWQFIHESDSWGIDEDSFAQLIADGYRSDVFISVYPGDGGDKERRHAITGRMTRNSGMQGNVQDADGGTMKLLSTLTITITEAL